MKQHITGDEREVYFPSEIQQKLGISKTSTYKFLEDVYKNKAPFTVVKIGKLYRITKTSFDCWFKQQIRK